MASITSAAVEQYLYDMVPDRDEPLARMEEVARARGIPIVGPAVGRVLYQYARLIGARRIFELGSAIGYSTIWLARAVGPTGRVYYTEADPRIAEEARHFLAEAGVGDRVVVLEGEAISLLAQAEGEFDLIFNDVEKHQYPDVVPVAVARLRPGGLFISDNVLWSGRVSRPVDPDDRATQGILRFNRLVHETPELFVTMLPLRDGLAVCLRR